MEKKQEQMKEELKNQIPLEVLDLIGDLKKCYDSKRALEVLLDDFDTYYFLDSLLFEEETRIWELLERNIGTILQKREYK